MSTLPNDPRHPWARLTTAARTVRDDRDTAAPYGFATRLAAMALAQERRMVSVLERLSLRALGVASLLAIASVAMNYQAIMPGSGAGLATEEFEIAAVGDAVAVVLDLADE